MEREGQRSVVTPRVHHLFELIARFYDIVRIDNSEKQLSLNASILGIAVIETMNMGSERKDEQMDYVEGDTQREDVAHI